MTGGYRLSLQKALNRLRQWLSAHHRPSLDELAENLPVFNSALVDHIQFLFEE